MIRQHIGAAVAALSILASANVAAAGDSTITGSATKQAQAGAPFLVAGIAANSAAQDQSSNGNSRHEGIGIGVKGGFLFNSFSSAQESFGDNDTGLQGGIFFGGNRPGTVGVMGELMYVRKGSDAVKLHYLEIPILLRVNAGSNSLNGVNIYGIGGPVFDIKLKTTIDGGGSDDSDFGNFDIGVIAGGGVEITRFIIEARYNWGLRNVAKGDLADITKIKTRTFAVLFGIRFN